MTDLSLNKTKHTHPPDAPIDGSMSEDLLDILGEISENASGDTEDVNEVENVSEKDKEEPEIKKENQSKKGNSKPRKVGIKKENDSDTELKGKNRSGHSRNYEEHDVPSMDTEGDGTRRGASRKPKEKKSDSGGQIESCKVPNKGASGKGNELQEKPRKERDYAYATDEIKPSAYAVALWGDEIDTLGLPELSFELADDSTKKVRQNYCSLLRSLKGEKHISVYCKLLFNLAMVMQSEDVPFNTHSFIAHLHCSDSNGIKDYSPGTCNAQGNNWMMTFVLLGVVTEFESDSADGLFVVNPDSPIVDMLKNKITPK